MFHNTAFDQHEAVHLTHDAASGLSAIIAIHDTTRGPSLGGCRVWTYESDEAALTDALRLSRAMTYKAAMADLPLGGGKSVVMVKERGAKTEEMFVALGRAIEGLGGRYIAAEDVGSSPADMKAIRSQTRHVTGLAPADGGVGDPSPKTADGCFVGLAATAAAIGRDVEGLHVAVQGLGHVGTGLAERLAEAGARLTVADIDPQAVKRTVDRLGASAVAPEDILSVEADILAPCALGGVLTSATIPTLKVAAVAGGANNQLATRADGEALRDRGILFAPDYVMNAGGVIKMCAEYFGWPDAAVDERVAAVATRLAEIFAEAKATGEPTDFVADRLAEARVGRAAAAAPEPIAKAS